jgi:hypothetical protein
MMCYKFISILKHITTATKSQKDLVNNPHRSGDIEFFKKRHLVNHRFPLDLQLITNNSTTKHPNAAKFELELADVTAVMSAKFRNVIIITITMLHRTCIYITEIEPHNLHISKCV